MESIRRSCKEGHLNGALQVVVKQTLAQRKDIFLHLLQDCIESKDLNLGRQLQALINRSGLGSNLILGNHLIRLFSVGGNLAEANHTFCNLPKKDCYTWREIILAFSKHGKDEQAVKLYHEMCNSETRPNDYVYNVALKACANIEALSQGRLIHAHILENRLEMNLFVGNALIYMYTRCGSIGEAKSVFHILPKRDTVSYNALIGGCVHHGLDQEALQLFRGLQSENVKPNNNTFVYILRACGSTMALDQGKALHAQILKNGLESDEHIGNSLVDMYAKCGNIENSRRVFNSLQQRDVYAWTAIISGCSQHGHAGEALQLFKTMQEEGLKPTNIQYVSVIKACSSIGALGEGRTIHSQIIASKLHSDLYIGTALVDMYAKCGDLDTAREVLYNLPKRTAVTWTALIAGYSHHGRGKEALLWFNRMQQDGIKPDKMTFSSIFKACGSTGLLDEGRFLHKKLIESRLEWDSFIGSTLIDMYTKCGSLDEALKVFKELRQKDKVSWTALIAGYAEEGRGDDALQIFQEMQNQGVEPSILTFIAVLKACASIAALNQGRIIHCHLKDKGFDSNLNIASSLIDMYAKCGSLAEAFGVFNNLQNQDVVSWTAIIAGCAMHGHVQEALHLFDKMQVHGFKPNKITLACILSVCSHAGLIDEGYHIFGYMCKVLNIRPTRQHYTCVIDLFGRAGDLHKAEDFLENMSRI